MEMIDKEGTPVIGGGYTEENPTEMRSISFKQVMAEKENTNSKLESVTETYKKYAVMQREYETNIIDIRAKEQISVGILDQKISESILEHVKLEECLENMPELNFLVDQYKILKDFVEKQPKRELDFDVLREKGIIDEKNDGSKLVKSIKALTKKTKENKKLRKPIYHAFSENYSEKTLKRRIQMLALTGERIMKLTEASKKALEDSLNELREEIDRFKERHKRIEEMHSKQSRLTFQRSIHV
jgi:hypothetical protein